MPIIEGQGREALVIVEAGDTSEDVIAAAKEAGATFKDGEYNCMRVVYPTSTRGGKDYSRESPDTCALVGFENTFGYYMAESPPDEDEEEQLPTTCPSLPL
ncbi:MAG: hypothetical protein HQ530_03950 [Parcubacteria group bacterium]|nr:hypothetical protein [Parcubacteria group bacterium]